MSSVLPLPSFLLYVISLLRKRRISLLTYLTDIRIVSRQPANSADLHWPGQQAKWDIEPLDAHLRKTTRGPYRETQVPSVVFVLVTVVVVVVVESALSSSTVRYLSQRPRYGTSRSFSYISCWHTWIGTRIQKEKIDSPELVSRFP